MLTVSDQAVCCKRHKSETIKLQIYNNLLSLCCKYGISAVIFSFIFRKLSYLGNLSVGLQYNYALT